MCDCTLPDRLFLAFCVLRHLKDLGAVNKSRNDGYQNVFVLFCFVVVIPTTLWYNVNHHIMSFISCDIMCAGGS